jgi:membrane-associated phospholipid phosphatase
MKRRSSPDDLTGMISTDTDANLERCTEFREARSKAGYGAREYALACLAGYLALSGIILAAGGSSLLALGHFALVAACLALSAPAVRGGPTRIVGDVLPLCVFPALYAELPALMAVLGSGYHDALIQGWEAAVFGGQPARDFAVAMPIPWLSELLHASYLAYYPLIVVPPLLLVLRRDRAALGQTMLALAAVYAVCWTIFVLFPVEGPRYLWPPPAAAPHGPVRAAALRILAAGSSRGAAFPSSHMTVSVVQTLLALRWQRRVGYALVVVTVLIGFGAVYGGFHYGIDMLAGALLGALIATLVLLDGVTVIGALSSQAASKAHRP